VTDGFPPGTLDLLDADRSRYQRERLAPGIRAEPRVLGSIFRINRAPLAPLHLWLVEHVQEG
jgi:hypothetical protein